MLRKNLHFRSWQSSSDRYGSLIQIEGFGYYKPIGTSLSVVRFIPVWSQKNG